MRPRKLRLAWENAMFLKGRDKLMKLNSKLAIVWGFFVLFALDTQGIETEPSPNKQGADERDAESTSTPIPQRLREGTELNGISGKFEITGDRITFYPADGADALRVLENLALERIARELSGIERERLWRVTGQVTEYQGNNFLLVTYAILKNQSSNQRNSNLDGVSKQNLGRG